MVKKNEDQQLGVQRMHVLNVRLPDQSIKWIDDLVNRGVYNSRSEAIRHFIRAYLQEVKR